MAEGPKPKLKAEDWLNRIIIVVIALFALIAGLPMVLSGAASILSAFAMMTIPGVMETLAFLIGIGLTAFAGMIAWKVFFGLGGREAD